MLYRFLADAILVVHVAFIAFVVVGLLLILLGGALKWAWVKNRWFRTAHLAAIGIVVAQAWLGVACPLTVWESNLRRLGGQAGYTNGFIADWLHRLIFFQAEPWVFLFAYTIFALLVLAVTWLVPIRWRKAQPMLPR